jgi:glycine/D-amino acid oxidase-like deaminating enzyme
MATLPSANGPTTVIVGGGVTGLSTAYHLARRGHGRVVVVDKAAVGDGSSSRAAAIITGLLWSETGVRARQESLRLFRELSADLEGYRFHDVGCLNLFDPQSWPERERLLPLYERCGSPFEVLDATEMRARWPQLRPPAGFVGLHDPRGGYSEPAEYIPALARRCRELGVEIREHEPVEDLLMRGGRVAGVRTAAGILPADAVVATLYGWTNILFDRVGVRLPVKVFVHQRYVTEPLPEPLAIPPVNANPLGGYIRPAAGGRLLAGIETADRLEHRIDRRDFRLDELAAPPELKALIRENFGGYAPAIASAAWATDSVGLISFAIDGEPILGPVARVPGLFVGVAFHSGGFAYNPVAGKLLAEFVADGRTSIDVTAFSPDRFDDAETDAYLAETLAQKHVVRRRH